MIVLPSELIHLAEHKTSIGILYVNKCLKRFNILDVKV